MPTCQLAQTRADLAIIALPPAEVAEALEVAGRMKCKAALVVSAGMDTDQAADLKTIARRSGLHLLGPNCLGFQRPHAGLNASLAGPLAATGSLALVSQSGALTSSILDWARSNGVGFSAVVSLGPNTVVDIADVLDFLAADAQTQSIVVCMEGIANARRFMSALRAAANAKPVVVLKAGRKPAGNAAAQTHSGTIVGSDDVFAAALRRAGAVRVRSFVELFSAAKSEFKHLEFYYFHNCVYDFMWKNNRRRFAEKFDTWDIIRKYNKDYKLIFIGDATMSPYEILQPGGSVEYNNAEAGAEWLQRLTNAFPKFAWINPEPQGVWQYRQSIAVIQQIVNNRMYPLTIKGLEEAMRLLSK